MMRTAGRDGSRLLAAILLISTLGGCAGGPPPSLGARDLEDMEPAQLMRLGDRFRNAGEPATALRFYTQAAERLPDSPAPLVAIGDLQLGAGRLAPAKEAYDRARRLAPEHAPALIGLAQADIAAGQPDAALAVLDELEAQSPQNEAALRLHNARGVALDLLGRHIDARGSYALALEASPNDEDVMNNLALSLAVGGEHAAALDILRELDARGGGSQTAARENMALVVAMTGRPDDAVSLASTVLPEKTAAGNRPFYDRLDELEGRALARAVFLGELPTAPTTLAGTVESAAPPDPDTREDTAERKAPRQSGEPERPDEQEPETKPTRVDEPEPPVRETTESQDTAAALYHLQLGAFKEHERLSRHWSVIAGQPGFEALSPFETSVTLDDGSVIHRLLAGPVEGYSAADALCRSLAPDHACVVLPRASEAKPLDIEPAGR